MFLNVDVVDIEKPDGIYWLTFVVDEFCEIHVCFQLQKNEGDWENKNYLDV